MRQQKVVIAGSSSAAPASALLREVRGSFWHTFDRRFIVIIIASIILHAVVIWRINRTEVAEQEITVLEKMPERFAKLIIEKPLPEATATPAPGKTEPAAQEQTPAEQQTAPEQADKAAPQDRAAAKKAVAARAARVEKKIRTVGVLGMLTGAGETAKGPAVVDVLGTVNRKKERFQDLETALEKMSGLKQAKDVDVLNRKLVRSKDIAVDHKESIDDLIAGIGAAETQTLSKKGSFIIQRPESIEGAASSNAKRDDRAISNVVSSHKTSIRMSYEKYLKRDPNLAGKVTVRFTISAAGTVITVLILENTTGNGQLERDIIRKVKMWRFEPIADGDVTVTYPFVFAPS